MGGKGQRDEREDREATLRGGDAELKGSAGRTRRIRSQWMRLIERGAGRRGEEREDVMSWNEAGEKIKVNNEIPEVPFWYGGSYRGTSTDM